MSLIQYLKDTRAELHHVAWPTRSQTIIFTVLVMALSILVSLYLGLFDYIFTNALGMGLEFLPSQSPVQTTEIPTATTTLGTSTPSLDDFLPTKTE